MVIKKSIEVLNTGVGMMCAILTLTAGMVWGFAFPWWEGNALAEETKSLKQHVVESTKTLRAIRSDIIERKVESDQRWKLHDERVKRVKDQRKFEKTLADMQRKLDVANSQPRGR
jgi:hypothetical protein